MPRKNYKKWYIKKKCVKYSAQHRIFHSVWLPYHNSQHMYWIMGMSRQFPHNHCQKIHNITFWRTFTKNHTTFFQTYIRAITILNTSFVFLICMYTILSIGKHEHALCLYSKPICSKKCFRCGEKVKQQPWATIDYYLFRSKLVIYTSVNQFTFG